MDLGVQGGDIIMECLYCDNGKAVAKQTYYFSGTVYISRLCSNCGKRIITYEKEIDEDFEMNLYKAAVANRRAKTRRRKKNDKN